jgi:hypothetical protein
MYKGPKPVVVVVVVVHIIGINSLSLRGYYYYRLVRTAEIF